MKAWPSLRYLESLRADDRAARKFAQWNNAARVELAEKSTKEFLKPVTVGQLTYISPRDPADTDPQ